MVKVYSDDGRGGINRYDSKEEFITKDSGKRQQYNSGMVRDLQDDKPDLYQWMPSNVPWGPDNMWYRLGMAAQRGANKYGRRNYEHANSPEELERFKASALRHLMQYIHGERDEDHAVACIFNLICAEMVEYKLKNESPVLVCSSCGDTKESLGGGICPMCHPKTLAYTESKLR
jgi:hypothetical protein